LRDVGQSESVANVTAAFASVFAVYVVTILVIKSKYLLAAGVALLVLGVPAAIIYDDLAEKNCFDRKTDRPRCSTYETPEGQHVVLRKDGALPPSSWIMVDADATHEEVRAYQANSGDSQIVDRSARIPHQISLDSCTSSQAVFFDASGRPTVYWSKKGEEYELWDRRGPHPITGIQVTAINSAVAIELCKRLDAAKMKRDTQAALEVQQQAAQIAAEQAQREQQEKEEAQRRLEAEQAEESQRAAAEAAQQAARDAAEQAQREQQEKEEAQRQLEAVRAEANRRAEAESARANSARPWEPSANVSRVSLNLRNNDCVAADVYLDGQKVATVPAFASLPLSIYPGTHDLRACQVGTAGCSQDIKMTTNNGPNNFIVNAQRVCGWPAAGYLIPAPIFTRMVGPRTTWFPIRMGRRR